MSVSSGSSAGEPRGRSRTESQKSLPTLVSELWELVVAYAKQQTIEPIKALGRYAGYGLVGSAFLAIGLVLLVLSLLRALQTETTPHFTGNLSWVPYLITLVVCAIVAGLSARAIGGAKRKAAKQ